MKKNKSDVFNSLYLKALDLYKKNELVQSEKIFISVYKTFKKNKEFEKYSICLSNLGSIYIQKGDFKKSLLLLKTSLRTAIGLNNKQLIAEILGNIGLVKFYRDNIDEALTLYKRELSINKYIKNYYGMLKAITKIANVHFKLNNFDKAIRFFEKQKELSLKIKNEQTLSYAYGGLAISYRNKFDIEKALYYYNKQIQLSKKIKDQRSLAIAYCNIGILHSFVMDYELALGYYKNAIRIQLKMHNVRGLVYTYGAIGEVYRIKGEIKNSLKHYKKQLLISEKLKMPEYRSKALENLGFLYNKIKKYDSANRFFRRQLTIAKSSGLQGELYSALGNLGENVRLTGNHKLSLKYFREQLELSRKIFGVRHPNTSVAYRNIGRTIFAMNDVKESLSYFQKALIANSKTFKSVSIQNNPAPRDTYSEPDLYESLKFKADALKKYSESGNNVIYYLQLSLETYRSAVSVLDKMRMSFREENSKYLMGGNLNAVFEEIIEIACMIYYKSGDEAYIKDAFYFAEKNKSAALLENIKESEAKLSLNLPKEILEKEKYFKNRISYNESEKFRELEKGRRSKKTIINKFNEKIFNLKREYNSFIETLEKSNPEYFNLKHKTLTVNMDELREKIIDDNSILIEYFVGNKNIYIFKITKEDISVTKSERKRSLDQNIRELRESITSNSILYFTENYRKFSLNSFRLFLILLKKTLSETRNKTHLIIIPDNILGYIPFEALITGIPSGLSDYKKLPYLIKNFSVSYGYSSGFLLKNNFIQSNKSQKKIIGFAPGFESPVQNSSGSKNSEDIFRSQLCPLNYNETELKEISRYFPGDFYSKEKATKKTFLDNADQFSIIHLATHCIINEKNPEFSRICFTNDGSSVDDSYLHNHELQNLRLNSRLAVLSACQTGFGKLIKGEGILSIARGFANSNCKSIVMSLWQVNDKSTSEIMAGFYKELFNGKKIAEALSSAKLKYLENANEYNSSPFFWAPFIMFGNSDPVNF